MQRHPVASISTTKSKNMYKLAQVPNNLPITPSPIALSHFPPLKEQGQNYCSHKEKGNKTKTNPTCAKQQGSDGGVVPPLGMILCRLITKINNS
jgi:hypothetical protein